MSWLNRERLSKYKGLELCKHFVWGKCQLLLFLWRKCTNLRILGVKKSGPELPTIVVYVSTQLERPWIQLFLSNITIKKKILSQKSVCKNSREYT